MATKPDLKAQKARKQKIILAVGGVLLVGVLALQLPKLLKHSSSASAAPATTVTTPDGSTPVTPGSTGAPSSPSTPVNVSATKNSAQLAGVVLIPAKTPPAAQGQLWSFSRFKVKDPFVPQVKDGSSSPTAKPGTPTGAPTTTGGGTTSSPGGTATVAAPPMFATLLVNGRPQKLTLHQQFPKADPTFVLIKLVGENARIGVAGGSFTAGNTILLQIGKRVTLMNTTTGQRYIVKLVYVGAQPETIAPFKSPATTTATPGAVTAIPGTVP